MITYDVRCDVCSESNIFALGTKKSKIRACMYAIKEFDVCRFCVTKAVLDVPFLTSEQQEQLITRKLTGKEKKQVIDFYNLV